MTDIASKLPDEHRALTLEGNGTGIRLSVVSMPQTSPGAAVIRMLAVTVLPYHRDVYSETPTLPYPTPLVPGFSGIGRVAALPADAASLSIGDLVYVDCVVRARDDPTAFFLSATFEGLSEGSKKLMRDAWRDGMFAEYAKMPLENCIPLNEKRLLHELGYTIPEVMYISQLLVPYGGLRAIQLEAGETIVVCPATGSYGGACVQVALAMGARVVAMGRNEMELERMQNLVQMPPSNLSLETVKISGLLDAETEALKTFGPIDVILDISPRAAKDSTHMAAALAALRNGGRCCLMGHVGPAIAQPHVMTNNLTLKGKMMYERADIIQFVKLLQSGRFAKGRQFVDVKTFSLADWKEAFDVSAGHTGMGKAVVILP